MRAPRMLTCLLLCLALVACQGQQRGNAEATGAGRARDGSISLPTGDSLEQSAVRFTQSFYDWYRGVDDEYEVAVMRRPELFAPELLSALQADMGAQHRCPGEICGLDFDPFTNSQDPCDPYSAGRTLRHGDTVIVAVSHLGCQGSTARPRPDVLVKLRRSQGSWQFVDLRFAGDSGGFGLLDNLALLARDRAPHPARSEK